MQTGEATFFELSGCYRRYHCPVSRTVFLGKPHDAIRRAEAALVEGLEAGLDAARAGNRTCDIANALGVAMDKAGIDRGARCGYSIGLSATRPTGASAPCRCAPRTRPSCNPA